MKQPTSSATETILAQNAEAIRALGKRVIGDIIEIGRLLTDAKRIAGHGNWLPWLDREFGWTDDTALNYMRCHEMAKSRKFRDLNLPVSGLYMLAAPSTPDEAREAVIERAQNGERLSVKAVRNQIGEARKKLATETAEPAQAEGAFPIYGSCAGGRVVTERTSTKPKAKAADTPELAPPQTDPDYLIALFSATVRSGVLDIARQIDVAYRPRLFERPARGDRRDRDRGRALGERTGSARGNVRHPRIPAAHLRAG